MNPEYGVGGLPISIGRPVSISQITHLRNVFVTGSCAGP